MSAQTPHERVVRIERNGAERQPVVVIDNYLAAPDSYVDLAAGLTFARIGAFYPGVRAPVPASLYGELIAPLANILRQAFGYRARAKVEECNFSLVTTPPHALEPIQRLPHFDGVDEGKIAALLYLFAGDLGGTSFYRHEATGYETVNAARFEHFRTRLDADVQAHGLPPAAYVGADTPLFTRIARFAPAFNRMLVYRGINLHCADIGAANTFSADPRTGRLTVNAFLVPAS